MRSSTLIQNILALYGIQIAMYVFPLAAVPYLARVLGPFYWGMVALAQAISLYVSIFVEFGFRYSATRTVARVRDNRASLEQVLEGVLGAKLLLAASCFLAFLLLGSFSSVFREHPLILWAGVCSGIGQGFSMLWYYQGIERLRTSAGMDALGKAGATVAVFVFVHAPADAWKVPALQCVSYFGVSLLLLRTAYTQVPFRRPTLHSAWRALRESAGMFLYRGAASLSTGANTLILAAAATPVAVGFYSGPSKLTGALLSLLTPLTQSLYPRLSRLTVQNPQRALALARMSLALMGVGSLAVCAAMIATAPMIVRLILGPGYGPAVPVLRVLSLLLPAIALNNAMGIQWMLPLGLDKKFNIVVISAGVLNVILALTLAGAWQQIGVAWAVVVSQFTITLALSGVLLRSRLHPFSGKVVLP